MDLKQDGPSLEAYHWLHTENETQKHQKKDKECIEYVVIFRITFYKF